MNRNDITTNWRRSWADRHPVLFETLGLVGATALVSAATATVLLAL